MSHLAVSSTCIFIKEIRASHDDDRLRDRCGHRQLASFVDRDVVLLQEQLAPERVWKRSDQQNLASRAAPHKLNDLQNQEPCFSGTRWPNENPDVAVLEDVLLLRRKVDELYSIALSEDR